MLFRDGEIVMRILSKPQLKELVLYPPQLVARLEKAGQFPKRVQLGPNRVGWVEDEVLCLTSAPMGQFRGSEQSEIAVSKSCSQQAEDQE